MHAFLATLKATWASWWSPRFADSETQPLWAGLLVAFLFNTAIALVLTAFAWSFSRRIDVLDALWTNWVIAQCVGYSIFGMFLAAGLLIGTKRIDGWSGPRRAILFALLPLAGAVLGYTLGFMLLGAGSVGWVTPRVVGGMVLIWGVLSLLSWRIWLAKLRLAEGEQREAVARERSARLETQAAEAQLRALQAQIEPHFLFNTLANVVSLIDARPADARRMLERLIELLRARLAASRAAQVTLGEEIELLRAYLEILSVRMGARLRYAIDLPAALREHPVPPLLLQPLVENAIRHGLEPKLDGGSVRITARAGGGLLQLEVADDGLGFGATTRSGVGLLNLRERLAAQHGERARLSIEDAEPGTRARIVLPLAGAAGA